MKRRLSSLSANLPDVYRAKKTKTQEEEIPAVDDPLFTLLSPSDTSISLQVLRNNFPRGPTIKTSPIILKSQVLYSVVDHSAVDRELSDMHTAGKIRIFKLGAHDEAIMFMPDYLALVDTVYSDLAESDPESAKLVKIFQTEVAVKVKDQAVSRDTAVKIFGIPHHDKLRPLIQHGLLALNGATSYKITIPNFGLFWKWIIRGRQEVESIISKQKHKEIAQLDLESKKLLQSPLGVTFHLKDLIGLKMVERFQTSAGYWLRQKPLRK